MSEKKHLRPEDIKRLNKIIVDLNMEQCKFVEIIEGLTQATRAADDILNTTKHLIWNHGNTFTNEVVGLIDLLHLLHPLIYGGDDYPVVAEISAGV